MNPDDRRFLVEEQDKELALLQEHKELTYQLEKCSEDETMYLKRRLSQNELRYNRLVKTPGSRPRKNKARVKARNRKANKSARKARKKNAKQTRK